MDVAKFESSPLGSVVPIQGLDGRLGRPYRHHAYVPDPLQSEPMLQPRTWHAVTAAHRALARLDAAARLIENPMLLRRPTLVREAQSTSALEGTFAPLEDVLAAEPGDPESSDDLNEVLNYLVAADFAFDAVQHQQKVTVGLLETAQGMLVRNTPADTDDAGRLRTRQVAIGSPGGSIEKSRFVPMPPGMDMKIMLTQLTDWTTEHSGNDVDPVVAAAMAHYQFETIHPFNDGNGRIGRLLVVLHFMTAGLLTEPMLSVSPWFEQRRLEYQDMLAGVSITGDWDAWIEFFAQGIAASAEDSGQRIDRLLALQSMYVRLLQAEGRTNGIIRDICDMLIGTPFVTVPGLARRLQRTNQAVSNAVSRLVDMGILSKPIGTYNRRFLAVDVWRAVQAPMGEVPQPDAPLDVHGFRALTDRSEKSEDDSLGAS